MRLVLVGLVICLACLTALGQVKGEVERIGFLDQYRPDAWVPMVVRLNPQTAETATYQIQVHQLDLDGDRVIYSRLITLTGNQEGQSRESTFWVYFHPTPLHGGLPDRLRDGAASLTRLQSELKVFLCTEAGAQITQLPIQSTILNIDPSTGPYSTARGKKLILAVSDPDTASQPRWQDFEQAQGILEDVLMVNVQPSDLPDNVIGYDAVDSIVWLDADPSQQTVSEDKLPSIRQWVRQGGNLVICQRAHWESTLAFGDLLPVTFPPHNGAQGVFDKPDLHPLLELARVDPQNVAQWMRLKGPFKVARAQTKPGARVVCTVDWSTHRDGADLTPYIVRMPYGLGCVTWVAQDIGSPALAVRGPDAGWINVWDSVFDWRNDPHMQPPGDAVVMDTAYARAPGCDLGDSILTQAEYGSRGVALIFLSLLFFIVYWLLAGPVAYLVLAARRKTSASWFVFAGSAIIATLFTVIVVKLVLRGHPEARHISWAKLTADQPAVIDSRIGLYIPRDGKQRLELRDPAPQTVSTITPFAIHPQYVKSDPDWSGLQYTVPIRDSSADQPADIVVPYRSTLKKFQTHWIGTTSTGILGAPRLASDASGTLEGVLTNATGQDLTDIYLAYNWQSTNQDDDYLCYLPSWQNGAGIDLKTLFGDPHTRNFVGSGGKAQALPGMNKPIFDRIGGQRGVEQGWTAYWYSRLRERSSEAEGFDDSNNAVSISFPLMSLFNRLPPVRNARRLDGQYSADRFELLRRGGRKLDMSAAISAGGLVVLAECAKTSLPIPFYVDGVPLSGSGPTFYQAVVPLDRSSANLVPATSPAAVPPSQP